MRRSIVFFLVMGCGSRFVATTTTATTTARTPDAPAVVTAACATARETRARAKELDGGGHEVLALAKLDEANAACPTDRAMSAALEMTLLANVGDCARISNPSAEAKATCAAREAPSKGTEASMRVSMRAAVIAERAKDWARAKGLYLDAWAELHPNPRALENAARMAALAGDAAESRRLRDRTLIEAETSEHATAVVTERVRVVGGSPRLFGTTLTLARDGKIVARDVATGELRVLLDASTKDSWLSPSGLLAFTGVGVGAPGTLTVWDVTTGTVLFKAPNVARYAASPDDKLVIVDDDQTNSTVIGIDNHARIYDVATGTVKSKLAGKWRDDFPLVFSPDDTHVLQATDDSFRQWDTTTNAFTSMKLTVNFGVGAISMDGHYFTYLETRSDGAAVHVRDMLTNKDTSTWTGVFHSLDALALSPDGKTLATGSFSSLRLWDVASKKQLSKHERDDSTSNTDTREYAFSDDGKTMVLAGPGAARAWDVATGTEKPLVTEQPEQNVLRVVPAPDGVAIVLEDEVRIVPLTGETRAVCHGMKPRYFDIIGPTNVAYSTSGKSFACAMSDGWVHVFDTSTWTERAVIKKGAAAPPARPVDLFFTGDASLTVVSDKGFVAYDAASAAEQKRVAFKHPSLGLAPRHARFEDGSIAVRLWNGSVAIFGADGAYKRDVKLAPSAIDAVDAFASSGATHAVAIGTKLHVTDLATGEEHVVDLPSPAKSLTLSSDGKTVDVVGADGGVLAITGTAIAPLAHAKGKRVWLVGKSTLVSAEKNTVDLYAPGAASPIALEIEPGGVIARDDGAFDVRGKPEVACVVGKTWLTRETCADREKETLVASWVRGVSSGL